ncbi:MAG TPA: EamA family transporter [Candidatus Limnocylindrales bacterium]|nr:EamA family transporter [Candidatus Limnocylindrales bacterium]
MTVTDLGRSSRSGAPSPGPGAGRWARAAAAVPPPGLLLVSIISIQLGAAVAINLFARIGPVATVFLRLAFAAVLLLVLRRRQIRASARGHALPLVLFGCVIGAMNLCFYGSIARIPLGIAVAIEFVGPLGVAAFTSRRLREFLWIGLAVAGLALLTPSIGTDLDPVGVALALAAGAGWATFVLASPRVGRRVGDASLALAMPAACLFVLPVELAAGGLERLDPGLLAGAFAVAVLSTALPLSLEFEALRRMTARAYGVTITLEPVVATLIGAALLRQAVAPAALLAIGCVTAAAIGVTVSERRSFLA